jgi:chromosome segregation ATPase
MSKIKIAIVCAVALAALATDVWQFQKIKSLRQENEALRQQAAQAASSQEELARAAQEATNAGGEASLQEAQVRDLARLRGEVARLREQTNQLAKARQEIQALQQRITSEAEARTRTGAALQAAQAEGQKVQHANACINNLRLIDASTQQWALQNKKQSTDTPTMDDLRPYLGRGPNGELPVCPDGGVYTVGTVGEAPTCSNPAHVLP